MVKWYSDDIEPVKSKNILVKYNGTNNIQFYGDYSINARNLNYEMDWKTFKSYVLCLTHGGFKWCYWSEAEKVLLKGIKDED